MSSQLANKTDTIRFWHMILDFLGINDGQTIAYRHAAKLIAWLHFSTYGTIHKIICLLKIIIDIFHLVKYKT